MVATGVMEYWDDWLEPALWRSIGEKDNTMKLKTGHCSSRMEMPPLSAKGMEKMDKVDTSLEYWEDWLEPARWKSIGKKDKTMKQKTGNCSSRM